MTTAPVPRSPHLRVAVAADRATITLERPDKRNMLEVVDLAALETLLDDLAAVPGLRVLTLTGAGERVFCAGFAHGDVLGTDWRDNPIERLITRLEDFPLPTVCVLNGGVYGAAADLALACDFRIGARGMALRLPAARLGVIYNVGGLRRFVARLGPGPARRLLLAAETIADEELLRIGFLDWLVERDDLAARAEALVSDLAALAPRAVQGMKRALVAISRGTLDRDRDRVEAEILACFASDDLREGLRAFAERREPRFTGQ